VRTLPFVTVDNARSFYRLEGNEAKPVLVLSHSIGCDHGMWAPQMPDLLQYFRVLRYDIRGHGASDAPEGEYSIEQLGRDVLALAKTLTLSKFAFCGLSLGGAIGQWLAIHVPTQLAHLVLASTSPQFGPRAKWDARKQAVLENGMAVVVEVAMQRFFSPAVLAKPNPYTESVRSLISGTNPVGYAGCCAALRDFDATSMLAKIRTPTLVITADHDVSTPWSGHGELLAHGIAGAQAVHLPAAHLSNIERPRSFTTAVMDFLHAESQPADPLKAGFAVRREVLGDEHVDRAIAATNDFNREFQSLITSYAWGTIWTRPGLDHRTRRLLTLAMMASLGRWEEFRLHVQAALKHGLEPCDLKEVLLQVAIYAGVPAANTGFYIVNEEMKSLTAQEVARDAQ
jgi:3-oxoadipate enol-lactonase/4-carboxymuconolactone decarboxylase